ncbi:nucleotidyltransferase family protein [Micromonospora pisi]|uniref:nucleotidyltransferase family protein n=1 Tax=Micromonospora pisi TaxID=589240 RepID=UPI001476F754
MEPGLRAGLHSERVRDVDISFFDPDDLSRGSDDQATRRLYVAWPEVSGRPATRQLSSGRSGGDLVSPLLSIADAVGTWPENAGVPVRLELVGGIETCATVGLNYLLAGVGHRNPRRLSLEASRARLPATDRPISGRWCR